MDQFRLRNLPGYGKLFVGLFTTLMLLICLWAVFIFYVDKGMVEEGARPEHYDTWRGSTDDGVITPDEEEQIQEDILSITEDDKSVLAPKWDSTFAGQEATADSISMAVNFAEREKELENYEQETAAMDYDSTYRQLRRNVGLAHTHINGQTLLFFALGLVFLFTSIPPKRKKIIMWIFAVAVVVHAIGLSGETFHWIYDDLLAVSGVTLLVVIPYMALLIYVDLAKGREE